MTWWTRLKAELRSVILGPYATGDPALTRLFGGGPTLADALEELDRRVQPQRALLPGSGSGCARGGHGL